MLPNKLMITSSKGGIGKSTVSVGLTRALAEQGKTILLVDCDFGNCCLDLLLGLENDVLFTLNDRKEILETTDKVLLHPDWPDGERVYFCPAPRGGKTAPAAEELKELLDAMETFCHPDFVILDTAAGIDLPYGLAEVYCNGALIVASQAPVSLRAAENTARAFGERNLNFVRLIINSFEDYSVLSHERLGLLSMIDQSAVQIVGVVPRDRQLLLAAENGKLPSKKAPSTAAFRNIAARLTGENVKLFSGIRGMKTKKLL